MNVIFIEAHELKVGDQFLSAFEHRMNEDRPRRARRRAVAPAFKARVVTEPLRMGPENFTTIKGERHVFIPAGDDLIVPMGITETVAVYNR